MLHLLQAFVLLAAARHLSHILHVSRMPTVWPLTWCPAPLALVLVVTQGTRIFYIDEVQCRVQIKARLMQKAEAAVPMLSDCSFHPAHSILACRTCYWRISDANTQPSVCATHAAAAAAGSRFPAKESHSLCMMSSHVESSTHGKARQQPACKR